MFRRRIMAVLYSASEPNRARHAPSQRSTNRASLLQGLNNIFYMFSTLICVFTLDRIGRRYTLYWGSVGQGIAMFLAGGMSRLGLNATAAGETAKAGSYGIAAAAFVYLFTFVFGATWLTVPWLYVSQAPRINRRE